LGSQFVGLLERLQPKPEFLTLFREIVLDVWNERRGNAASLRADLEARLTELKRKETALEEAYIYDQRRTIDATTYERQRDKLREEIAIAEIERQDAHLEEIDVEGILGFAEHVLGNAARLWFEATPEQKQRLQRVWFPEGLRYRDGGFRTAVTCFAFTTLERNPEVGSGLASPSGLVAPGRPFRREFRAA